MPYQINSCPVIAQRSSSGGRNRAMSPHKEDAMKRVMVSFLAGGLALMLAGAASAQEIDWKKVDAAIGKNGAVGAGGVHRYGLPRSDLNVTLDGVTIKPALALGGWVAFG